MIVSTSLMISSLETAGDDDDESTSDFPTGSAVFTVAVGSGVFTASKIDVYQLLNLLFSIFLNLCFKYGLYICIFR